MFTAILSMFLATPTLGSGQAPATGAMRQSAFESLKDSQGTRGQSAKRGAIVGALLGAGIGALLGASLGETDTDRTAFSPSRSEGEPWPVVS
jgi:hypothetical protein